MNLIFCYFLFFCLFQIAFSEENENNSKESEDIIGIDLGTTYSCVGVMVGDRIEIIPNDQGNRITPSYVAFTDDEEMLVGDSAKNQMTSNPANTIYNIKRIIGRKWNDPSVEQDKKLFTYQLSNKNNNLRVQVKLKSGNKEYSPEEISSFILKKMKETAEKFLKRKVKKAVITVPAYFTDSQRSATKDAGKIAGLDVIRTLNEPTAAAIAYGLDKSDKKEKNILVYDLGGGTFDVSLLTIDNSVFEVLATSGDTHLGGEDFDEAVIKYFIEKWQQKNVNLSSDQSIQRLRREVEKAKRVLSSQHEVKIEFSYKNIDFSEVLTRSKFEELNIKRFEDTLISVKKVLEESGIDKKDLDEIVMVGGSTRIPKIKEIVKKFFNNKELNLGINPDEAVAYGAAVQAAVLSGKAKDIVLIDVTPLTLGLETLGGVMTKLIPSNSITPTQKSQIFSTAADNQQTVTIKVYEGERQLAKDNHFLGQFDLTGIPPAPRGVPQIEVTFSVDANGILSVSAEEKGTQNKQQITINNNDQRLSQEEIAKMIKDAETYAEEDKKKKEIIEQRQELENLAYRIKKQSTDDSTGKLSKEDKKELTSAAEEVMSFLSNNPSASIEEIQSQKKNLEKISNPIISKLYNSEEKGDQTGDHTEL